MGSKSLTRLGVLAAASGVVMTLAPGSALAAAPQPIDNGSKPIVPFSSGAYRISGLDRQEVSVNAAKVALADGKADGKTFVIASGYVWPDAVSVTPLSGCMKAPVLLSRANGLGKPVADFLKTKKGTVTRVVISGGEGTVSPAVEAQLKSLLGNIKIERNGGENRQAVAYNNAAEAAACQLGSNSVSNAHDALQALKEREAAYQSALAAYNAARDAYDAAKKADDAAQAQVDALVDQLNAKAMELVSVPAATQKAYDDAVAARQASEEQLNKFVAAAQVINGLATTDVTTTELQSTMTEYLATAGAKAPAVQAAMTVLGIQGSNTIQDAIGIANTKVDAGVADVNSKTEAVSQAALALQKAATATAQNAAVAKEMAAIQDKLNAARAKKAATAAALAKAQAKLTAATTALADALANRPTPGQIADAVKALDKARDEAVKAAGKQGAAPAFLATGRIYTDALTTGPAAVNVKGVVLLTGEASSKGDQLGTWATRWKTNYSAGAQLVGQVVNGQYVAVGGDAIKAAGKDYMYQVPGADRYEVSVNLAKKFFKGPVYPSVASGQIYADAITGGAFSGLYANPLVLTKASSLPLTVDNYLRNSNELSQPSGAVVIGGPSTVTAAAMAQIQAAISAK
ncbi:MULTISPECIES: cell wall-binding repeat-containing protein [unclassified Luteococcus]|uniref:cell wall-binding repeat-containing protein n=1 Tax=unclassified Luteococcus TaxID=2639923 RepID=UPI00313A7F4B